RNESLIKFAAAKGLREVLLGVESGSDKILKIVNKGTTRKMNLDAIKLLHSLRVKVKCAFIIGLPGESRETLRETEDFCREVKDMVADFDFTVFVPYHGSRIYQNPEAYDIRFDPGEVYRAYKTKPGEYISIVSTSSLTSEEIAEARNKLEAEFKPKERLR
ncbi:MAG: radical SAM protein, partial [Thermoplasmata archaeon]|nr:radical SAM protein [Thermoplasmata archaeon]